MQWLTLRLVVCCRCQLAGSASRWLPQNFRYPMHTLLPLAPAASRIQMIHLFIQCNTSHNRSEQFASASWGKAGQANDYKSIDWVVPF